MAAATAMWAPAGSPGNDYHRYDGGHTSYEPPSPTPSNQSRTNRFTQWFSRSRSNSPNTQRQDGGEEDGKRSRSRGRVSRSRSPNESSFVVRNVVKQNGGVSWDIDSQGNQLQYRRSKSKPIGMAGGMSLGVPPGGPGGGTGYGTADSHNDGRIIRETPAPPHPQQMQYGSTPVSPPGRPASPGHTKAAAFQRPHRISPGPLSQRQHDAEMQPPRAPFAVQPQFDAPGARTSPLRKPMPLAPQAAQAAQPHQAPNQGDAFAPFPASDSIKNHVIPGFDPNSLNTADSVSPINIPTPGSSPHRDRRQSVADQRAANFGFIGGNEASPGTSPGLASRIKGFFAKPNKDDEDDGDESEDGPSQQGTPYGVSPDAYNRRSMTGARVWSGSQPAIDAADKEAEMLRKRSQKEAAKLIDEERRKIIDGSSPAPISPPHRKPVPSLPSGLARELVVEGWTPEALNRMTESGRVDLVRRLTVKSAGSGEDRGANSTSVAERIVAGQPQIDWDSLTPAQRIIAETRSRHLEQDRRASIAAANNEQSPTRVQRGFDAFPARADTADVSFGETPVRRATKSSPKKQQVPASDAAATPARPSPAKSQAAPAAIATPEPRPEAGPSPALARKDGLAPGRGPMPSEMGGTMPALQEMMTRFYRFERYAVPLLRSLESRLVDIERDAQMAASATADGASDRTGRTAREREMDRWVGQMTSLMKHEIGQLKAGTNEIREGRETLATLARQQAPASSRIVQKEPTPVAAIAPMPPTTSSSPPKSQLTLPPGSAPALDKDEGKYDGQHRSTDSGMARSTSPSGRPKYTSALGRPMIDGRVSPAGDVQDARRVQRSHSPSPAPSVPALPSEVTLDAEDEEESQDISASLPANQTTISHTLEPQPLRASALAAMRASAGSPVRSDDGRSSARSASSTSRSVNDRLKALMQPKASTPAAEESLDDDDEEEAESELPPLRTAAASMRATHDKEASGKSYTSSSSTVTPAKLAQQQHLAPPPHRSSTTPAPRSVSPTSTFIGGRTSPSPASYAGLGAGGGASPSASPISSPLNLSPSIPATAGGDISTGRFASQGLRARAQNYLGSTSGDASPVSASRISTPSDATWAKKEDTPPSSYSRGSNFSQQQQQTRKMTAPAKTGMTLKERVAFFEVNNR